MQIGSYCMRPTHQFLSYQEIKWKVSIGLASPIGLVAAGILGEEGGAKVVYHFVLGKAVELAPQL